MSATKQFHIFHDGSNFSADQLALITDEVNNRRYILKTALFNLNRTMQHIEPPPKPAKKPAGAIKNKKITKPNPSSPAPKAPFKQSDDKKALKGRVSYKVKGPGGKLMNIAEVKAWVNSIYDGKQGIVKYNEDIT